MIRLAIRCRAEDAERVLAELLELAPNGVEEEEGDGWFEFAVYGPPGEVPDVGELAATAGAAPIEVSSTEIPDDWADRWRDFHRPIEIGGRAADRPSVLGDAPNNSRHVLAFGSGRARRTFGERNNRARPRLRLRACRRTVARSRW